MLEDVLGLDESGIKEKFSSSLLIFNNLGDMLFEVFESEEYKALNNAYPNKFKPWELKRSLGLYWTLETAKEATRWLIEEKLKIDPKEAIKVLKRRQFYDNGLQQMLYSLFEDNPCLAVLNAYPELCKKYIAFKNI